MVKFVEIIGTDQIRKFWSKYNGNINIFEYWNVSLQNRNVCLNKVYN